jgi:catechol-2,3-dioxygenase
MIGVLQVGLIARDSSALAEFYRDVLGRRVVPTDTAVLGAPPTAGSAESRRC